MQHLLARLILLLSGHWKLAFGRIGPVRWDFAAGGWTLLAVGDRRCTAVAVLCYRRTTEGPDACGRGLGWACGFWRCCRCW